MRFRSDSDGILPLTLTEVIILLFFVLALAFAWNVRELGQVPEEVRNEFVSGAALEPEGGWTVIVRCIRGVEVCDPGVGDALVRIAEELGIDAEDKTPKEIADSVVNQIESARATADSILKEQGLDPTAAREGGPFTEIINAFRGQGDYPPCWADYSGDRRRIIYAAKVTLFTERIRMEPMWPPSYADSAAVVTGLLPLTGDRREHTYGGFAQLAAPVLEWSDAREPPCRHYVEIHDSVFGGDEKENFKRNLLTVEGFFYKNPFIF